MVLMTDCGEGEKERVMEEICRRTDCAVQPSDVENISGTALGVAVESGGAESSTASGSEWSGSGAGREGEDGVTHLEDWCGVR
jgi:hypothetical protein